MAEALRVLPPKGKESFPVFIPSGHCRRVYRVNDDETEGTVLPPKYQKEALKLGCVFVGQAYEDDDEGDRPASSEQLIVDAIEVLVSRDEPDDIDGAGRPKLQAVKKQAGFNITRDQLNSAWATFKESLE